MSRPDRQAIKMANLIHDRLHALHDEQARVWDERLRYMCEQTRQLLRLDHSLSLCRRQRWPVAADKLRRRAGRMLVDLNAELTNTQRFHQPPSYKVPSLREILAELEQIEAEFGGWTHERNIMALVVHTDAIVLEGINLGSFKIALYLDELPQLGQNRDVYIIEAVEPNPAASDPVVTHPHVSRNRLCEGDASVPIRKALESGRLCDFFMVVSSVLTTYNPHSAYVSLGNWDGIECYDCGYHTSESNSYYCESCNRDFCGECISGCRVCDTTMCRGCLLECGICRDLVCEGCIRTCESCNEACCTSCLEDGLCATCLKEQNERENDEQEERQEQQASRNG